MHVIVAGGRDVTDYDLVAHAIEESGFRVNVVISGAADGADTLGEQYARKYGLQVEIYPADWRRYGKVAGIIRNKEMARVADALVAVWDGKSPGTRHMIEIAKQECLPVYVKRY